MKIRAYPFLQQEGQAPRAGEKKETPPATRRSLLPAQEERCYQEAEICESLRARVRSYLAQVHRAQAELHTLQGNEEQLAEAERLYQQVGKFLAEGEKEQSKNVEALYLSLGKVREKLAELLPKLSDTAADPAAVLAEARAKDEETGATKGENKLKADLQSLSLRLEAARQKLTERQKELIAAIAHNLVAVENITASDSAIRDAAYARKVMAEVKDRLTTEAHHFILSQANRENIAALLG